MLTRVSPLIWLWILALATGIVVISAYGLFGAPKHGVVNGILFSIENPSAVLDGQIIKEGDIVYGAKVVKIDRATVEFKRNGKRWKQWVGGPVSRHWK